jgi:soluble lytic murein transglycosylase-like protein
MVGVPTYEPGGRRRTNAQQANSVNPDMFGAGIGRAMVGAGEQISRLGDVFAQLHQENKAKDDTARVMDAYTAGTSRLRETLYDPENGLYNRTGQNAAGVTDLTSEASQKIFEEVGQTLENDDQREAFRRMWERKQEATLDGSAKHEFSQMGAARTQAKTAGLANLEADIIANYKEPAALAANFDAVRAMIRSNPDGLPAEAVEQLERESVSKLHLEVIQRMALDEPGAALDYYEKNRKQVSGGDHALAEKYISAVEQIRDARGIAQEMLSTGSGRDLFGAMLSAESSGDPAALSPAGAQGLMQLMPGTAREVAFSLGLKSVAGMGDADLYAFFKTPEGQAVNKRLGQTYMSTQLKRFGGDVEAALIAYNAGPDNARKWLDAGRDYSALPKPEETLPYVSKILKKAYGVDVIGDMEGASARYQAALKGNGNRMFKGGDAGSFLMSRLQPGKPKSYIDDMSPAMRDRLAAMMEQAPDYVKEGLDIMSGARSVHRQAEIIAENSGKYGIDRAAWEADVKALGPVAAGKKWEDELRSKGVTKNIALPGRSHHNSGEATDLGWNGGGFSGAPAEVREWVHSNAGKYGLKFPMGHEPWHVELSSTRTGKSIPREQIAGPGGPWKRRANPEDGVRVVVDDGPGNAASIYTDFASPYRVGGSGSLDAMLMDAEERYWDKPDLLAEVQRQIKSEWSVRQSAQEAQANELKLEVFRGIMADKKVSDFPPSMLEAIGPEGVSSLLSLETKFSGGGGDKTDDRTYLELTQMDPEELKSADLLSYAERLSMTDFKKFADKQAELLRGNSDAGQVVGMRTRTQIVNDTVAMLEMKPTKNADDAKSVALLERQLDDRVAAFAQSNNGRAPSAPEIQEMVDKLILEGTIESSGIVGGLFGDKSKRVYEATPEELSRFTVAYDVGDIPPEAEPIVAQAYRGIWGEVPGEEGAVDFYNDMVRVSLGASPAPPDGLKSQIIQALVPALGRRPSEDEIANTYRRMIERATGMNNGR